MSNNEKVSSPFADYVNKYCVNCKQLEQCGKAGNMIYCLFAGIHGMLFQINENLKSLNPELTPQKLEEAIL